MKQSLVFKGEPKSTQHIYRYACRGNFPTLYMTAEGKALKEQYHWEAKSQWKGKPLAGEVALAITLYFGTRRKADLDNFNKLSLDALTGVAFLDDSQISDLNVRRSYDKSRPRIEISISEISIPAAVGD